MKQLLSVLAPLALLTAGVCAQDTAEAVKVRTAVEGKIQIEMAQAIGGAIGFEAKVVKGAPYSATAESETTQRLMDGNRIHNKTTTMVYRDGEGRTRREIVGTTPGVPAQVFISDPVNGTNYSLNPKQRVAVKQGEAIKLRTATMGEKGVVTITGDTAAPQSEEAKRAVVEQKMRMAKLEAEATANAAQLDEAKRDGQMAKRQAELNAQPRLAAGQPAIGFGIAAEKNATKESLGQQTIEGVLCEGKRTTVTIAAGVIGNDLPINLVTEEWYSPELQALVLTKRTDPRNGETIYRLTNINRSEPARALFEVPSDYTVQEGFKAMPMLKKVAKEEQ